MGNTFEKSKAKLTSISKEAKDEPKILKVFRYSGYLRWKQIPKCNLGRNSHINWIPITGKTTICSGKTLCVFGTKDLKDQNGVLVSNVGDVFGRWGKYFKDLLNPVTFTPSDTQEVHSGEGNIVTVNQWFPTFFISRPHSKI